MHHKDRHKQLEQLDARMEVVELIAATAGIILGILFIIFGL